jgi:hypothetical protein
MPPPDEKKRIDYVSKARAHAQAARDQLAAADAFGPVHACLHARLAIEALAYDLLQNYLSEVSHEAVEKWTPGFVLKEILYVDEDACSTSHVRFSYKDKDGVSREIDFGESLKMSPAWANRMHNALGNFLHQPTVRQMLQVSDTTRSETGRRKAKEALDEIERVLASSVWSFRAHQLLQINCKCGSVIARDKSFLEAKKILECSNCGRFYTYWLEEESKRYGFRSAQVSWTCKDCGAANVKDADEAKPGNVVECSRCAAKFELANKIFLVRTEKPKSEAIIATIEDVQAFAESCVSLRSQWTHFRMLFEGADLKRELLQTTAPTFFDDLNGLLIEHVVLHICRLTDEAQTMGRKNLTAKFLVEYSDWSNAPDTFAKAKAIDESIHNFRDRIVPARNKFIAHHDLSAVRLDQPLGAALHAEWKQFWLDLEEFLDLLLQHHGGPNARSHLNGIAGLSDADSLVTALRNAKFFEAVMSDQDMAARALDIADASRFAGDL